MEGLLSALFTAVLGWLGYWWRERGQLRADIAEVRTDIAVLNKIMLPRVDHDIICDKNWERIHKRFDELLESLEKRDAAAADHRHKISESVQILVTKLAVLDVLTKGRRR